jgi:hypothetical protein
LILLARGQYPPQNEIDAVISVGKSTHFTVRPSQLIEIKQLNNQNKFMQVSVFLPPGMKNQSHVSPFRSRPEVQIDMLWSAKNINGVPNCKSKIRAPLAASWPGNHPGFSMH